jgi:hypothetical protein
MGTPLQRPARVTAPARSWQCGGQGFVFIRSESATSFGLGALNPQDWSGSSGLTSTNVSILTSRQLHTRKVAGSIPSRDHPSDLHEHGLCTLWLVRFVRFLSGHRRIDRFGCVESVEVGGDLVEFV